MFHISHRTIYTKALISAIACSLLLLPGGVHALWRRSVPNSSESAFLTSKGVLDRQADKDDHKDSDSARVTPDQKATQKSVSEAFSQRPLAFEVNQGQTHKLVNFFAHGSGYNIFLTASGLVLTINRAKGAGDIKKDQLRGEKHVATLPVRPTSVLQNVVRMRFLAANRAPKITGSDDLPGKSNYFVGGDEKKWLRNIPNYAKVRYGEVYSGVDVVYQSNKRHLQYDFLISSGASPSVIRMAFDGIKTMRVAANGDLVLGIEGGEFRQSKPTAYQEIDGAKRLVPCRYIVKANREAGFAVEQYDKSKPLIIDPTLVFSTFVGGSEDDRGFAVSTGDPKNNVYITGWTWSPDFPTNPAAIQRLRIGNNHAFVVCYNTRDLFTLYSTYLGGNMEEAGHGISVDQRGNVYVTGWTRSDNFPRTSDAFQPFIRGSSDAFVTKLDYGGSLSYSSYLGGSNSELGEGIVADSTGNMYIAGGTLSADFPHDPGPFRPDLGGFNAFLTKLRPTGVPDYSMLIGGSGVDIARGVALDDVGNAYVTGETRALDFYTTPGTFQERKNLPGLSDGFVVVVAAGGGALVYSTYLGGKGYDVCQGIAVDREHNAYVTGYTDSNDFPTMNAYQSEYGGGIDGLFGTTNFDVFVTKLDSTGAGLHYSTYLGSTDNDGGNSITTDGHDRAYVTGWTGTSDDVSDNSFPLTPDAFQRSNHGYNDTFVVELKTRESGRASLAYSTYVGGGGQDIGHGIALVNGVAYITGQTTSLDFPTGGRGGPGAFGGYREAFLAWFDLR